MAVLALSSAHAESTRSTHPTVVGIEALGRASSASVFVDHMLDEDVSVGFGFGGWPVATLPVYGKIYVSREQASFYLTGGLTIVLDPENVRGAEIPGAGWKASQPVVAMSGFGYENRSPGGYLFRAAGYLAYVNFEMRPWGGVSVGYAF